MRWVRWPEQASAFIVFGTAAKELQGHGFFFPQAGNNREAGEDTRQPESKMKGNPVQRTSVRNLGLVQILAALCLLFPLLSPASEAEDRFLVMELMDRYGVVHDFGTPEQYADLFTEDGEIATGKGRPAIVKGRQALIQQAKRDHERFGAPPGPDGEFSSIMRHVISNRVVSLTGPASAEGQLLRDHAHQ